MTDTDDEKEFEAAWLERHPVPATEDIPLEQGGSEAAQNSAADDPAEGAEGQAAGSEQDEAAIAPPNTDPETNPTDEIWANATPEQRAAYEAASREAQQLRHRVKSDEGRVAAFQRERDEYRKKIGAITSVAEHEDTEAYLASEEWQKLKADYGDELKPALTLLETLVARDRMFSERMGRIDESRGAAIAQENSNWLDREAPDWRDLATRPDFQPWLEAQPHGVREMAQRNWDVLVDPAEAKTVFDLFRGHVRQTETPSANIGQPQSNAIDRKRDLQLKGAKSVTSRAPVVTEPDEFDEDAAWNAAVARRKRLQSQI